jgi:hypothetical protein
MKTNTQTTTETTPANDSADDKASLFKVRQAWEAAGSKMPDDATKAKLLAAYKAAQDKVAKAKAALEAAQNAQYAASRAIIEATGAQAISIDNVVHQPAARNGKLFFRSQGQTNVVKF